MQKATEGLKLKKKTMYEIFATSARCPSSSLRQRQAQGAPDVPEVTVHPAADFFLLMVSMGGIKRGIFRPEKLQHRSEITPVGY